MKFIVIIPLLIIFNCIKCELDKCFHHDDHPFQFFASKTAYSYVSSKQNYTQPSKVHLLSNNNMNFYEIFYLNIFKIIVGCDL